MVARGLEGLIAALRCCLPPMEEMQCLNKQTTHCLIPGTAFKEEHKHGTLYH